MFHCKLKQILRSHCEAVFSGIKNHSEFCELAQVFVFFEVLSLYSIEPAESLFPDRTWHVRMAFTVVGALLAC